jgi:hypothetical protein
LNDAALDNGSKPKAGREDSVDSGFVNFLGCNNEIAFHPAHRKALSGPCTPHQIHSKEAIVRSYAGASRPGAAAENRDTASLAAFLTLLRPPPPISLLYRKAGVARLSDCATERIEHAWILACIRFPTESIIEIVSLACRQLLDGGDAQTVKVRFNGFPNAGEVAQAACVRRM